MVTRARHLLLRIPVEAFTSVAIHALLLLGLVLLVRLPHGAAPGEQVAEVHSTPAPVPPLPEPPPPRDTLPPEPARTSEPVPRDQPPPAPEIFEDSDSPSLDPADLLPTPDFRQVSPLRPSKSVIGIGGGRAGRTSYAPPRPPPPKPKPKPPPPPSRARPTSKPPPEYPTRAVERELEGRVVLLVEVLPNGDVGRIEVKESSGHAILDRAAIAAVRRWQFVPARAQGQPVRSLVEVPFSFRLRE